MALLPQDPDQRKKFFLGMLLVGGLGFLGYERVYTPKVAEVQLLQDRLAEMRTKNQAARAVTAGVTGSEEVEQRLVLYRGQLSAVENLVPSSEELPDLLNAIAAEARRSGVELSLIQPVGATEEAYYTRRMYDLVALGSYHGIGEFLTHIASLPRIITPLNLSLNVRAESTREGEQRLEARFSIETYVLSSAGAAPAAE
jgi:type IV pilus assembly protein PilO